MWKSIIAGAAALAMMGGVLVHAQAASDQDKEHARTERSAADMSAFADARIAALKAGLKLTTDQEKDWPAVEQALRDLAKLRIDRVMARRNRKGDEPKPDPVERLGRRADAMGQRAAALKKLADAAKPLYASLDDAQKRRARVLVRSMRKEMRKGLRHNRRDKHDGDDE